MKRVLVIAYYFPPMGLSGIQRTVKFVKYLGQYGWRPTVVTIMPHAYFAFDDSFESELEGNGVEVWRTPPGGIFSVMGKRRTVSLRNERLRKFLNRLSQFFFVPDNKVGWRDQVMKFLAARDMSQYDVIYATAPPFTDLLIGLDLKRRYGLPLVVDFRDAWVEYPYHVYWTSWHRRRHQELERGVVAGADAVITTNGHVRGLLLGRQSDPAVAERVHVITQGYDATDFAEAGNEAAAAAGVTMAPDHVNFVYTGIFYEDRDPLVLFRALVSLKLRRPDVYRRLRFYMVGYVQEEYQQQGERMGIADRIVYCGYVEHAVSVAWVKKADVLWFNIGSQLRGFQTVSPGKAFEYLGSGKPIVAILPENEIREMLSGFDHTFIVEPDDHEQLAETLIDLAERHERGELPRGDMERIARYDRRRLTGDLVSIFEKIIPTRS